MTEPGSNLWNEDTLTSLLDGLADSRPEAPAILTGEGTIDYRTLKSRADALARGLQSLGVGHGDVVSVQLPNVPEFLIAYLATARLGAVTSTIHMPYGPREAGDAMRHAGSKIAFGAASVGDRRPAEAFVALKADLPSLAHVIAVGGDAPTGAIGFDEVEASGDQGSLPPPPKATDISTMLFTSGTSASPKAVRTDYRRFLANARVNHGEKRMRPSSSMLSAAPYTHLLGLYSFHLTLYGGGATALLPAFSPPALIEAFETLKPTHVFVAPAHVAACLGAGLFRAGALSSIEYMVISGAKAAPSLYHAAQEALPGGVVAQLWGMTEVQCGMFTRPDEPIDLAANACGRPSLGNEARVCDLDGKVLPPGEEGELQIRGASVFDGYFENDAANAASFAEDGWFRTGDRAVIDAHGAVTITGREKDLINRGGVKINPADVEEALDRHPNIIQSAIVPMPDPILGEKACCFAVAAEGKTPALEDLTDWLETQGIAKLKWPERLVLIDEMPLTPTRKVIKGRLEIPD